MKRKTYGIVSGILIAVMVFSCSMGVYAASTMDATEKAELRADCSLEIIYSSSGTAFTDKDIKLWHIADLNENEQYALTGVFTDYPIEITGTTSQTEWDEMTVTLNSYILADGISPDRTGTTDVNGKVSFENLTVGMYLVGSVRTEMNGKNYVFESFMVVVPGVDENGRWVYNVSAKPKMSENTPSKGEVTYKAVKIWKDNGKDRPDSVDIDVFKDGVLQKTVTLSSENNWMYAWTTIDDGSVWSVAEKSVPDGYTVGIQKNGDAFHITNAKPYPDEDSPVTGDTTNMAVWFLIAAVSGSMLVILGVVQRKKHREE